MLHDRGGKRKDQTRINSSRKRGSKTLVACLSTFYVTSICLSSNAMRTYRQSAFFLINVGTSRSSTRLEFGGAGNSSGDRGEYRGGVVIGICAPLPSVAVATSCPKPVAITVIFIASAIVSSMT